MTNKSFHLFVYLDLYVVPELNAEAEDITGNIPGTVSRKKREVS